MTSVSIIENPLVSYSTLPNRKEIATAGFRLDILLVFVVGANVANKA